jgi:hypothetical protein
MASTLRDRLRQASSIASDWRVYYAGILGELTTDVVSGLVCHPEEAESFAKRRTLDEGPMPCGRQQR